MNRILCILLALLSLSSSGFAQCRSTGIPRLCACLAEQMTDTLQTHIDRALPIAGSALMNLDNPGQTSPLGRILARNLAGELAVRGFLLVTKAGTTDEGSAHQDELLGRPGRATMPPQAVLTGTYAVNGNSVTVTAELIRVSDNLVLTTATGILQLTPDTRSQLAPAPAGGRRAPERLLSLRDKTDIRTIQQALAGLGLYTARIDGFWGKKSKAALAAFRSGRGMDAKAVWDMDTQQALLHTP